MKTTEFHRCVMFLGVAVGLQGCQTFPVAEPVVPERSRITVFAFRQVSGGRPISDGDLAATTEMLLNEKGFKLINRRDIESILTEAEFSLTGAVRPDQALEIGKLFGSQLLASITRVDYSNGTMYTARLTDLTSGQVVNVTQNWTKTPGNPFPKLIDDLVVRTRQVDRVQEPNERYCNMNGIKFAWKLWFELPLGLQILSVPGGGPLFFPLIAIMRYPFQPNEVLDTRDPIMERRRVAEEECPKIRMRQMQRTTAARDGSLQP